MIPGFGRTVRSQHNLPRLVELDMYIEILIIYMIITIRRITTIIIWNNGITIVIRGICNNQSSNGVIHIYIHIMCNNSC